MKVVYSFCVVDNRTRRSTVRHLCQAQSFRDILHSRTVTPNQRLSILNVGGEPQEPTSEPLPQFSRNPRVAARRYAAAKAAATAAAEAAAAEK